MWFPAAYYENIITTFMFGLYDDVYDAYRLVYFTLT